MTFKSLRHQSKETKSDEYDAELKLIAEQKQRKHSRQLCQVRPQIFLSSSLYKNRLNRFARESCGFCVACLSGSEVKASFSLPAIRVLVRKGIVSFNGVPKKLKLLSYKVTVTRFLMTYEEKL